jgi:hypothetical protein
MNSPNKKASGQSRRFEPMLLLVIGIPLLTLIAGIVTLAIAFDAPAETSHAPQDVHFKSVPLK